MLPITPPEYTTNDNDKNRKQEAVQHKNGSTPAEINNSSRRKGSILYSPDKTGWCHKNRKHNITK